jgi:branched-chain amino acid transport system permease protein
MVEFFQHIINGLSLGAIYALIALGYTMVFGVLQLINFAHGEVFMVGAFIGYYASRYFGLADNPSLAALFQVMALAMIGCAILGLLIEKLAYRPMRKQPRINVLITAVGVSLLLQFGGQIVFGSDPKFFPQIYQPAGTWDLGAIKINPLQVNVLIISLILMAILQYVIFKTRIGRAMRAVSFDHKLASLQGIPTDRVISYTFMIGSALAGAGGVLVGLIYPKIEPLMGVMPGLKAFVAAVLGGIGNITGAFVGAMFLGLSEQLVVGYGASTFRDAIAFVFLILILLFKPTGLFGKKGTEKV